MHLFRPATPDARTTRFAIFLAAMLFSLPAPAAIIGTNVPAKPLTKDRIAALPARERSAWADYLKRSQRQRAADLAFLKKELAANGMTEALIPKTSRGARSMPLEKPAGWYAGDEAHRIADNIVSFQTPAGGWSKNLDVAAAPRQPGELFGPENSSRFLADGDFDGPHKQEWSYVGTFDNDATTSELRFLARVISAGKSGHEPIYRKSFVRGLDYIFEAQFPNGGWPQVWPLQGGYHDSVTFNDNAMTKVLELLRDVAEGEADFAFVPGEVRSRAAASQKRGINCVLAAQIIVNGRRTVWGQQHDPITLEPDAARNFEMPSASSGESAELTLFLMRIPDPSPELVRAVHSAAAWFEKTRVTGFDFKFTGQGGRHLVPDPNNGPIWARYYRIPDDKPIFGDRDKTIHDDVEEISAERRAGYSWYTDAGRRVLEHFARWRKAHPLTSADSQPRAAAERKRR